MTQPSETSAASAAPLGRRAATLVSLVLLAMTLAVYADACRNQFVDYDDGLYVAENPHVLGGLTRDNIGWAFSTFHVFNWHPLTWLSLQLDAQLSAPPLEPVPLERQPAWIYHLTNVLLHSGNVVLLFLLLRYLTGMLWRSAVVAALFAVHPLHVESVAWVSVRKDVLCVFFALLTLLAYAWYARRPNWGRYLLVTALFALGLMAKPMLVTLPCVLLLLDYWPLGRFAAGGHAAVRPGLGPTPAPLSRLLLEKLPWLALSALDSVITWHAQERLGALQSLQKFPLGIRVGNAFLSYLAYLGKTVWPVHLAVLYPHPGLGLAWGQAAAAAGLLVGLTALVLTLRRRLPYLAVGWLWYLGTLVPVIGLVQVGVQGMADRYTYLPHIGLFILAAWGMADLAKYCHCQRLAVGLTGALLVGFMLAAWVQVSYWRDTLTLWQHALEATSGSALVHQNLGKELLRRAQWDEATHHFQEAARLDPQSPWARCGLGLALQKQGKPEEALLYFQEAVRLDPSHQDARSLCARTLDALGASWLRQQEPQKAEDCFHRALEFLPDFPAAHYNLSRLLLGQRRTQEAQEHLSEAVRLVPELEPAQLDLALLRLRDGKLDEAAQQLRAALEARPGRGPLYDLLGRVLARQQKWAEAAACLREALRRGTADRVGAHRTLAFVLGKLDRRPEAEAEYREAYRLNPTWPQEAIQTAWSLATDPDPERRDSRFAVELAEQACEAAGGKEARFLDTLAAAYASVGRYDRAVVVAEQALTAAGQAEPTQTREIRERLDLYRKGQPFRERATPR